MKFVCLGYFELAEWNALPDEARNVFWVSCIAYEEELKRGGHLLSGELLPNIHSVATLKIRNHHISVSDASLAHFIKMPLNEILIIEARDLSHAIALLSKHPVVRVGAFEIRPTDKAINTTKEIKKFRPNP